MRIAVSGTHGTGKSTLLAELAAHLDGYEAIDEPYYLLDAAGYAFSDPPSADDFVALLDHAVSLCSRYRVGDILFDRSPADYLAYGQPCRIQRPLGHTTAAKADLAPPAV